MQYVPNRLGTRLQGGEGEGGTLCGDEATIREGGVQVGHYSEHVHHCMQKKMIDTQDTMRRDVTS